MKKRRVLIDVYIAHNDVPVDKLMTAMLAMNSDMKAGELAQNIVGSDNVIRLPNRNMNYKYILVGSEGYDPKVDNSTFIDIGVNQLWSGISRMQVIDLDQDRVTVGDTNYIYTSHTILK